MTQAILCEGRNRVRLYAPEGFERTEPTLEDAYFVLMQSAPAVALGAPMGC